jgi:hypothetical protein
MGDGAAMLDPLRARTNPSSTTLCRCRDQAVRSCDPTQLARLVVGERVRGGQEAREGHTDAPVLFPREALGEKLKRVRRLVICHHIVAARRGDYDLAALHGHAKRWGRGRTWRWTF